MSGKFKFSVQGSDLPPFVGNETKIKIPSVIKPPLVVTSSKNYGHLYLAFEKQPP
jgi:hypothetical protein